MKLCSSDWWDKILLVSFQENDWLENFRMEKDTFQYICYQLRQNLRRQCTVMRQQIPVEKKIAVTIWWLATYLDYCTIGHLFGISRGCVCCIVHEVCEALMPRYIKWPEGEKLKEVGEVFQSKWGYPQCCGAVDGSHILILAPTEFHTDFFNSKGWHSIILQGVVDLRYRFPDITLAWPGCVHDARVLANSSLFRRGQHMEAFQISPPKNCNECLFQCIQLKTMPIHSLYGL